MKKNSDPLTLLDVTTQQYWTGRQYYIVGNWSRKLLITEFGATWVVLQKIQCYSQTRVRHLLDP